MIPRFLLASLCVSLSVMVGCGAAPTPQPTAIIYPTATTPAPVPTFTPSLASPTATLPLITTRAPATATRALPTPTRVPEVEACRGGGHVIALIVDPRLMNAIRASLDQFSQDLCQQSYTVVQRINDFASPADVRAYLAKLYGQTQQRLIGTILIGAVPHAYQWVTLVTSNPNFPSTSEEVISFQYYGDLNGTFQASPNYKSPGKHAYWYDVHTGDLNWEIWVGLLPIYKGDLNKTIDALNRYFAKNHAYRAGESKIPRAFLEVNEHYQSKSAADDAQFLKFMKNSDVSWTAFSNTNTARLYFDTKTANLSLDQGYADLSAGVADFSELDAHGFSGASGKLTIAYVESKPIRTIFFWSNGCAIGNLDLADNFLTSVLYSPTSAVLVAKGTTNDSGGMGTNASGYFGANIATAMARQYGLGEAMLYHINQPLINPWAASREFHYGSVVVLGDPTLYSR